MLLKKWFLAVLFFGFQVKGSVFPPLVNCFEHVMLPGHLLGSVFPQLASGNQFVRNFLYRRWLFPNQPVILDTRTLGRFIRSLPPSARVETTSPTGALYIIPTSGTPLNAFARQYSVERQDAVFTVSVGPEARIVADSDFYTTLLSQEDFLSGFPLDGMRVWARFPTPEIIEPHRRSYIRRGNDTRSTILYEEIDELINQLADTIVPTLRGRNHYLTHPQMSYLFARLDMRFRKYVKELQELREFLGAFNDHTLLFNVESHRDSPRGRWGRGSWIPPIVEWWVYLHGHNDTTLAYPSNEEGILLDNAGLIHQVQRTNEVLLEVCENLLSEIRRFRLVLARSPAVRNSTMEVAIVLARSDVVDLRVELDPTFGGLSP